MKKVCLFLALILFINDASAQIINFPDQNLKNLLLEASAINSIAFSDASGFDGCAIDVNSDGEIEISEALAIRRLELFGAGISDMTGIQYFTNLKVLNCSDNLLTTLDLSGMNELNELFCSNNQLSDLSITSPQITWLNCNNNLFTNIDFANLGSLFHLQCDHNDLSTLDLTGLSNLFFLTCSHNDLTSLTYSSSLLILDCSHNLLTTLDITPSGGFIIDDMTGTCNISYNPLIELTATSEDLCNAWAIFDGLQTLERICCRPVNQAFFQELADTNGYANCVVDDSCLLSNDDFLISEYFTLYPNPVNNILNIRASFVDIKSISILSMLGQHLMTVSNPESISTINVAHLEAGNYLIKVNSDKGSMGAKFIKE